MENYTSNMAHKTYKIRKLEEKYLQSFQFRDYKPLLMTIVIDVSLGKIRSILLNLAQSYLEIWANSIFTHCSQPQYCKACL